LGGRGSNDEPPLGQEKLQMKIHLAWIRVTAAAALVGVGVQQSAAQYAPFKPIPPDAVAPAATYPAAAYPAAAYPTAAYPAAAYPTTAYQPTAPAQAYVASRVPAGYPQTQLQAPSARYQAPVTAYQAPAAPAQYGQPAVAYPQTAARYPAAYPYVASTQPTEVMPAPQGPGPGNGNSSPAAEGMPATAMPATAMPVEQGMAGAPVASGYTAAGCGCGGGASGYAAAGCGCGYTSAGCAGQYPDVSNYFGNCGSENQWFGGVYWLDMERSGPHPRTLAVEVPDSTPRPYYPQSSVTFISTANVEPDFRSGIEVRLGSTFSVGGCDSCGSGYGYGGCGCNSCAPCNMTQYAWEVAWWGIDNDVNDYTRTDELPATSHIYGMQNFNGVEYSKHSTGTYRPVNDYYEYQMPINDAPPTYAVGDQVVLAQRVYTNFSAQNLELNIMRFPVCDSGCGCGGSSCGGCGSYDTCGCNSGCTSCQAPTTCFSMYGSCGVRYFRTDDDFSYDTESATVTGVGPNTYDKTMPTGVWDLCYDINIDNNLIGPQLGWTTDYCICCRWNIFMNSTFGIFGNHIDQSQRLWSPDGTVRFNQSQGAVDIHNHRDDIAFLGELRAGCSYDINCHWRAVAAYRAVGMTGVATAIGQIPDNFANSDVVGHINTDNSVVIHGIQTGVECRY
jgi:hypothetical protein